MKTVETTSNQVTCSKSGYSDEYRRIRSEAEANWPEWKKSIYNVNFAISTHAQKIFDK